MNLTESKTLATEIKKTDLLPSQLKQVKTGDLVLTTWQCAYLHHWVTASITNHSAMFVWVESDQAYFTDEKVEDKFRLEYGEGRKLFIFHVIGTNNLQLIPFEKTLKNTIRAIHRPVEYGDGEVHLEKFKKFFRMAKDAKMKTSYSFAKLIACIFAPTSPSNDHLWEQESCSSLVVLWLNSLGYSLDTPGTPQRSRQLITPDHFLVNFNSNPLLAPRENILINKTKLMGPEMYFSFLLVMILLFVTIITVVIYTRNPLALIALAVPFVIIHYTYIE